MNDVIRLGMSGCFEHKQILKSVIATWQQMSTTIHENMMLWWVYFASRYTILPKGLFPYVYDLNLVYALWFEC